VATAIPAHIELLRDFVNTADLETGEDRLSSPSGLEVWLADHGLGPVRTNRTGVEGVLALREAVRRLLLANAGLEDAAEQDWAIVEDAARRGHVALRHRRDGALAPEAMAAGLTGALGRLAVAVSLATQDGSWLRLKACRAHDCHWAFYDEARNHSRQWCSMSVCGNREKVRVFRARHAPA
jgi:predicted RNA-binding Zn ribbon-like protein